MATMKSRESIASPSRRPSGVESAGLPATVTNARICPSPGVSISSRIVAPGRSPPDAGGLDPLQHRRAGELAAILGKPANPAPVAVVVTGDHEASQVDGRLGE